MCVCVCGELSLNEPRPVSEFLFAETAELRAKQLSNISYDLQFNLDSQSEFFSGITEISFDLAAGNQNDLSIDFSQGDVQSITKDGKPVVFTYEKWFITIPAAELSAGA